MLTRRLLSHMFGIAVVIDASDTVVAGWASGVVLRGGANQSCYRRPERCICCPPPSRVRRSTDRSHLNREVANWSIMTWLPCFGNHDGSFVRCACVIVGKQTANSDRVECNDKESGACTGVRAIAIANTLPCTAVRTSQWRCRTSPHRSASQALQIAGRSRRVIDRGRQSNDDSEFLISEQTMTNTHLFRRV